MDEKKSYFDVLYPVDVNNHTEKRKDLTYLSWTWAVQEVTRRYPDMTYRIIQDPVTHLPYFYDENTGYMVMTEVTIDDHTKMMWLPVMDSNNKAMKKEPYEINTKYGKVIHVNPCTMFDVNKAIMRCLTKNIAMFGLGLYIYAGEDLPEVDEGNVDGNATITKADAKNLLSLFKLKGVEPKDVLTAEEAETMSKITVKRYAEIVKELS
jgi:hypothetical protein